MSIQQTHFIIQGIKFENLRDVIPNDDSEEGKYDDIMEGPYPRKEHQPGDVVMVADFLGSRYAIVGILVYKGDEFGIEMTRISKEMADFDYWKCEQAIAEKHREIVEKYKQLRIDFEISLQGESSAVKKPMANMGLWVFTNHS